MNSAFLFGSVFLFSATIGVMATFPPADSCSNLTSAFNMNLTKLNGSWYIQKYTGPVNSNLQTRCDFFTFVINGYGTGGSINYTYQMSKDNSSAFQLASLMSLPQNGKYEYQIQVAEWQVDVYNYEKESLLSTKSQIGHAYVRMNTTIVVMQDDTAFVHVACNEGSEGGSTVVIATRVLDASPDVIRNLEQMAMQQGASDYNMQQTNLKNCTFPSHLPPSQAV